MGTVMSNFQIVFYSIIPVAAWEGGFKVIQKSKQKPAGNKSPVNRTSTYEVTQTHNIQGHNEKNQTYAGLHTAPSVPGSSTAHRWRLSVVVWVGCNFITVGRTLQMNALANLMTHILTAGSVQTRTCSNVTLKHQQSACVHITLRVHKCKTDITNVYGSTPQTQPVVFLFQAQLYIL